MGCMVYTLQQVSTKPSCHHGPANLWQCWYDHKQQSSENTHTQAYYPDLYLHSVLFPTLTVHIHLVFHLCQHILGPSAPCWALNSCVSLRGRPLRSACLHNTHVRVAGETHLQSHLSVNLSLSPPNSTSCSVNTHVPGKKLFLLQCWVHTYNMVFNAVCRQSWPESGHSFPRQGHRDLALRLHHSACPPGATWPDCSSPSPSFSYAWICIKQRHGCALVATAKNRMDLTRPHRAAHSASKLGWQAVRVGHQNSAEAQQEERRFTRQTKIDTLMVFHFHSFNIRSWHCLYSTPLSVEQRAPNSQWWRGRRIGALKTLHLKMICPCLPWWLLSCVPSWS